MKTVGMVLLIVLASLSQAFAGMLLGGLVGFFTHLVVTTVMYRSGTWVSPSPRGQALYLLPEFVGIGASVGFVAGLGYIGYELWKEWKARHRATLAASVEQPEAPPPRVMAQSVYRDTWRRIVVLQGAVEGELEYDTTGIGESVYLNGEKVAQSSGIVFCPQLVTVAPRIDFTLPTAAGPCRARIEATIYHRFWKGIKDFRLTVGEVIIYDERDGVMWTDGVRLLKTARDEVKLE